MADSLEKESERNVRIAVGGPDVLTLRQIGLLAAYVVGGRRLRSSFASAGQMVAATAACNQDGV